MHILREYERWGLCGAVKKAMGIGSGAYMRLQLKGDHTAAQRLKMLEEKRSAALEEIHFKERQLRRREIFKKEQD